MRAAVHLFRVVLITLFICALTLTSNADILVKEKSNHNNNYYTVSFDNEFDENVYDREELEELRKDIALEYVYEFIGDKFRQTPIGMYIIQKFDKVISYGRIEYSKKHEQEKPTLYLPGMYNKNKNDVYDYRASLSFSLYIKHSKPCPTARITWLYRDIDHIIGYDIKINEIFLTIKKKFYDSDVGISYEIDENDNEDEDYYKEKDERVYFFVMKGF